MATAPKTSQSPYGGFLRGTKEQADTGPHCLVIGPTGSGKTVTVLAPAALVWRGPRVLVSSKTDLARWTVEKGMARRGPLYIMDLAGEIDDDFEWLQGVAWKRVVSDPTALIANSDDALAMASLLMKVGSLGASDGGGGGGDGAFWETLAAAPLAALLEAGKASGQGMRWVTRAISRPGDGDDEDKYSKETPSWPTSVEWISHTSNHAQALEDLSGMDPKMRDSIKATMQAGVRPWDLQAVMGKRDAVPFSPELLEGKGEPTLIVVAPADGVAAGAAVGAIETIVRHWRRGIERGLPRVLLLIDELTNTAPLPKLPTYVTEARGLGVAVLAAIQNLDQLSQRWGQIGGKLLQKAFPSILTLKGALEKELYEGAAWWDGDGDVVRESFTNGQVNRTTEKAPMTVPQSLLPEEFGVGRLLLAGRKGVEVDLPPIYQWPDKPGSRAA